MKYRVIVTVVGIEGARVVPGSALTLVHERINAQNAGVAIGSAMLNSIEDAEKTAKNTKGTWGGPYIVERVECSLLTETVLA